MKHTMSTITGVTVCAVVVGTASYGAADSPGGRAVQRHPAEAGHCALPRFGPGRDYHPTINPANFTSKVTNRYFPLPPGHTYIYTGVEGKHRTSDIVAPSRRTRMIDHVRTRIVNDRVVEAGRVTERTSDYYAQDRCGNVWYFGEDTAELDRHGHVTSREGSFHAGVDGAEPGVFMQRHPQIGRKFRQEWYAGHAEDVYQVVRTNMSRKVLFGSFHHVLLTLETNPLEAGVRDHKNYARHIGSIVENTVKGPTERLKLVDLLR
jgi:hypothetical protein